MNVTIDMWIKHSTTLLLALLMVACGSFGLDEEQLLQRARDYLQEREYKAAAIELRNTLQKNPENAEARYLLGVITLEYGDYASAEREFLRADLAGWGSGSARIDRARALLELNRFQELVNNVELEDSYSDTVKAELLALRAAAQAGLEETDKARATLSEAVALDPDAFQVFMTRIQFLLDGDELQTAASEIDVALEQYPGNPELLLLRAKIDLAEGDSSAGKQVLQTVIDSDPPGFISIYGVTARLNLVRQLILEGSLEEAAPYMATLYKRTANAPYTNYLGGLLAFEMGDYDLAEQRLLQVLKVTPDDPPTRLLFATAKFAQQDYEQAAYYLAKYLAVNPDHLAARKLLGRSYMLLGQQDNAIEVLEQAGNNDDAELLAMVGLSELQRGDVKAGVAGLKNALAVDPDNLELRKELALAYLSTGETGLAIKELQSLVKENDTKLHTESLLITAYLQAGEFDRATELSLDLFSRHPQDPAIATLTGTVFAARDDKQEARKYFNRALSISQNFIPAMIALARIEELEGNTGKAIELYRNLMESGVDSVVPVLALARLEGQQGNTQQVIDDLQAAIEAFPGESRLRLLLAGYYLREKQYQKADPLLNEAAKTSTDQPVVKDLQARLLIATGRYQEAITALNESLKINPESAVARVLLADAHLHMGSVQHARDVLQTVIRQSPDDVQALALMTKIEILSGNLDQAMSYSQRIQQAYPALYLGYELLGDVWVAKKNDTEAGRQYDQAWEHMQRSELAIRRAEVALRLGDEQVAVDALLSWLDDHPDDLRVRRFLATTYHETSRDEEAIAEYLKVLATEPDDVAALNNLAWIYYQSGNASAQTMAERAFRVAPDNPSVLDTYGWILLHQNDVARGRQLLEQASRQLPEVADVSYHYAVALYLSGDQLQAREILEALLAGSKPFEGREHARQLLDGIPG